MAIADLNPKVYVKPKGRIENLGKPWSAENRPRGGRKPGARNLRNRMAERLGLLLLEISPDLAALANQGPKARNIPAVHARALKRLSADPVTAGDAMRLATLVALGAAIVTGARPAPHSGSTCPRCKRSLFGVAGDPLPLMLGGGPVGWFHPTCLTAALQELVGRARIRVTEALEKDGRKKIAGQS